jgi:hypothetical protein
MSSLLEGLARQLDGDVVARLGEQIGADPATTADAVRAALPVIVGGLANNASSPEGAGALDSALSRDHDGSLLDNLGVLFGGAPTNPRAVDGGGILEHILGGRRETVQEGIGRSTGLDTGQVMQLLSLLAPIVMAYLGRRKQEQGLDSEGLGGALRDERARMEQQEPGLGGLLGQLFDQNRDGSVADDLFRMAPGMLGGLFGNKR